MTVWLRESCSGDLHPRMQKAHSKIARLYESKGKEMYVSSRRDGRHMAGSFHYNGCAEDILDRAKHITLGELKHLLGSQFDIVEYDWGFHVEWDPAP